MYGTNGTSPGYFDPNPWRDHPPLSGPCGRTDPRGPTRSLPDYNPNIGGITIIIILIFIVIIALSLFCEKLIDLNFLKSFFFDKIIDFVFSTLSLFFKRIIDLNLGFLEIIFLNLILRFNNLSLSFFLVDEDNELFKLLYSNNNI